MKHFAECILFILILAIITLAYSLVMLVAEGIQTGLIQFFAMWYGLGFLTPCVIIIGLLNKCSVPPTTAMNTSMNNVMSSIMGVV